MLMKESSFAKHSPGMLWGVVVEEVVLFSWCEGSFSIHYEEGPKFSHELLNYWFLHTLLPVYFTCEKIYDFLHAGAVSFNGLPLLFTAPSFGGKSTMTDFFIKQGHPLLSDDKVAVYENGDDFWAVPSYPYHRPYRRMEDLGCFVDNFAEEPKPIHAIYELVRTESDAPIEITPLHGIDKFKSLRFVSEINLPFRKPQRMEFLGRLANTVPVYAVQIPWEPERLGEVYEHIVTHVQRTQ